MYQDIGRGGGLEVCFVSVSQLEYLGRDPYNDLLPESNIGPHVFYRNSLVSKAGNGVPGIHNGALRSNHCVEQ